MSKPDDSLITTSGTGQVKISPTLVFVTFTVEGRSNTAVAANADLQRKLAAVDPVIKANSKVIRDIRSLRTEKVYPENHPVRITGHSAAAEFCVQLNALESVAQFIDNIIASGATYINETRFDATDQQILGAKLDALKEASRNAIAKATAIGEIVFPRVPITMVRVDEGAVHYQPVYAAMASTESSKSVPSTPVSPGQLTIEAKVTLLSRATK